MRLERIADYINETQPDIVTMQELSGGARFQLHQKYNEYHDEELYPSKDCYKEFEPRLKGYVGELVKAIDGPDETYLGNAIYYKDSMEVVSVNHIKMTEDKQIPADNNDPGNYPYKAIAIRFKQDGQEFEVVTGHFRWVPRPFDIDATIIQAAKVKEYLEGLDVPFVLTGDFNVHYNTITAGQFEDIAFNLTKGMRIRNTLNGNIHRAKMLFPEGVPCDHVYVSPGIDVFGLQVERKRDLSDHYGIEFDFEIRPKQANIIGDLK